MKKNNSRWYWVILLVLCIVYISACFLSGQSFEGTTPLMIAANGDSTEYVGLANSLLHGYFALPGEMFEQFRTPGYPLVIASIQSLGLPYMGVTLLQVLLAFAIALMIRALGTKVLNKKVGDLASILFLLNPLVLLLSLVLMSDMVFTFLFFLGVSLIFFYIERYPLRTVIGSGILFGMATYVRPAGVVALPLFIMPILFSSITLRKKIGYTVLLGIVFIAALIPWMLRNYVESGVFSFSSLAPYNLTVYNVPMFETVLHGDSETQEENKIITALGIPQNQWRNLTVSAKLSTYDRAALSASLPRYIAYHIFESTGFFLNSGIQPLLSFMSGPLHYRISPVSTVNLKDLLLHHEFVLLIQSLTAQWWVLAEKLCFFLGACLMLVTLWVSRRKSFVWVAVFTIGYFALLSGPVAQARYRLPVAPFDALLISAGFMIMYGYIFSDNKKIRSNVLTDTPIT